MCAIRNPLSGIFLEYLLHPHPASPPPPKIIIK
jgi:hypothetical protein